MVRKIKTMIKKTLANLIIKILNEPKLREELWRRVLYGLADRIAKETH